MNILKLNVITAVMLLSIATDVFGQAGSLDPTFDTDGIVTTAVSNNVDAAYAVAMQPDGKIVITGRTSNASYDNFLVMRYNSDGSLDTSFDSDGIVITDYMGGIETGWSVLIQPDNKIVIAGTHWSPVLKDDIAIVRYNTDGSLDTTFDSDGIVTTDINGFAEYAWAAALQTDGKILIAGYDDSMLVTRNFAVVRYNTNGSLDTTFGSGGIVTTVMGGVSSEIRAIAIQPNGKIVVGGSVTYNISVRNFALARYNIDGSLDNTFNSDGKVTTSFGAITADMILGLAIQPDGKIIATGSAINNATNYNFALARYTSIGNLDNTFDADGKQTIDFAGLEDESYGMGLQADGKIVLAGRSYNGVNYDIAVARVNTDGSLDSTFDNDGKVTTPIGIAYEVGNSMVIQNDGKIVVAGWSYMGTSIDDVALVRYNNNLVGITENNLSPSLTIYPNPMLDELKISVDNNVPSEIFLYDIVSRKMLQQKFTNYLTLDTERLEKGIYIYEVRNKNGVIKNGKIVKE